MGTYIAQDIKNVLYDAITAPLTADGNSTELDFDVLEGCPDSEIALNVVDIDTGESVEFALWQYDGSTWVDTGLKQNVVADGEVIISLNNRMVTGSKLRLAHDLTLPTGSDGVNVHGHLRPRI